MNWVYVSIDIFIRHRYKKTKKVFVSDITIYYPGTELASGNYPAIGFSNIYLASKFGQNSRPIQYLSTQCSY
jgi:hypothetical protein